MYDVYIYIDGVRQSSPLVLKFCFTQRKIVRSVEETENNSDVSSPPELFGLRLYQKEGAFLAEPRYIREDRSEHIGTMKSSKTISKSQILVP